MKHKRIWVLLVAVLIVALALLASTRWPNLNSVFGGIAASIVAALIFWFLTDVLQVNSDWEKLSSIICRLENLENIKTNKIAGLTAILRRDDDEDATQYWINFVNSAQHKLTLSGRTLNRWLDDGKKQQALTKALTRIVKKKVAIVQYDEPIRLIIYSDDGIISEGNRLGDNEIDILLEEQKKIKSYLLKIWDTFTNEQKKRFRVYEIDHLPYLYCNNGYQCVTGTYFDNRSDKMNLMLVFNCGYESAEHEYTEDLYLCG